MTFIEIVFCENTSFFSKITKPNFVTRHLNDIDIHEIKWNYIKFVQILIDQIAKNWMIFKYIESKKN